MRGGWRYRAGRTGWRRKCEQSQWVDVRMLHRLGRLQAGTFFSWSWNRDGEPWGSISLASKENHIHFSYSWTPNGGTRKNMAYDVAIEWTRCRYGGSRPWFHCPWCERRCALIYGLSRDGYFGCRLCLRLAYSSEAESPIDRCWRQQRKLEARLTDYGGPPKGMHQKTFERISNKLDAMEQRKDDLFLPRLFRLTCHVGINPDDLFK